MPGVLHALFLFGGKAADDYLAGDDNIPNTPLPPLYPLFLLPPSTCVLARCNHLHSLHTVRSHEAAAAAAAAAIVHAARGFSVAPNASHMSAQLVTPTGADCTLLHAWCHTPYTPRAGARQQHCEPLQPCVESL